MEGFISRLFESVYSGQLVLNGGMLMSTFADHRPTRDIDLQGRCISSDTESLTEATRRVGIRSNTAAFALGWVLPASESISD